MEKLLMCDWAGMSPLEVALCQNAFQTSDPARCCAAAAAAGGATALGGKGRCQINAMPDNNCGTKHFSHYSATSANRSCQRQRSLLLDRYPLGDAGLQLVYDVIGVLTTVHRWAFSTRGWHLRLQAPAGHAPAVGYTYNPDMPGNSYKRQRYCPWQPWICMLASAWHI
jgi:hypothetical protein